MGDWSGFIRYSKPKKFRMRGMLKNSRLQLQNCLSAKNKFFAIRRTICLDNGPSNGWPYYPLADTEARRLRRLNSIPFGRALKVGQTVKLDFEKVDRGVFHAKRRQYHLDLQNLYLSRYKVDQVEKHILKRKQNVWTLCQRVYKIPLWLLKKYNTEKDLAKLIPGDALHVPIVVKNNWYYWRKTLFSSPF